MGMYINYRVNASNGCSFEEEHKTWAEDSFLHCLFKAASELGVSLQVKGYPEWGGEEEVDPNDYSNWDEWRVNEESTHECSEPWEKWWSDWIDFYKKRLTPAK